MLAVVTAPLGASAFPELQIATGAVRCDVCHYAPAGGGLLNGRGRYAAEDELSAGGDGSFLHGAVELPGWIDLGGDFRGAAIANDVGQADRPELAVFPMQADLRARLAWKTLSANVTAGLRGSTRAQPTPPASLLVSREHFLQWKHGPLARATAVRAGRFAVPQGLRLPDHTLYIRRFTGQALLEEPYALSGSLLRRAWEIHATAYVHDPVLDVGRPESGVAALGEIHDGPLAVGLSSRLGVSHEADRILTGAHGRAYVAPARLALLAEWDFVYEWIEADPEIGRAQLLGYTGADLELVRSLHLAAWYERFDQHLGAPGTSRDAFGAALRSYPWAHFEVTLHGKVQLVGERDTARLAMLQLHYYP
ncbi:MAG: hypothetical protein AABZ30_07870 [Myxococcota bacterium]